MDILLLLFVLAIFLLPSFFMMRSQRKRQQQVKEMQYSIVDGDRIVTVAGFHATVVATRDTEVDLELAPGTVVTMERQGILRKVEETPQAAADLPEVPGSAGDQWNRTEGYEPQQPGMGSHPENYSSQDYPRPEATDTPDFPEHPEEGPRDNR